MVVDVIERDLYIPPRDAPSGCKTEEVIGSATVGFDGSFTATFGANDGCTGDTLPDLSIELRVRSGSVVLRLRRLLPERAQVGGRSRRRVGRQGPRPHLQQQHRVLAADAVTKTPSIANTFAGFARYSR